MSVNELLRLVVELSVGELDGEHSRFSRQHFNVCPEIWQYFMTSAAAAQGLMLT